jgi:mannose-6-phosphate isomerase-like protein (cupin superfamily)
MVDPAESSGTAERMLLQRDQTDNGNASLSLLELDPDARLDVPAPTVETAYYLLSGRGTIGFPQFEHESRWIVDPDGAAFSGAGAAHTLHNAGEGPFRCLAARCVPGPGGAPGRRVTVRAEWPVHDLVGFVSRTVFDRGQLEAAGAARTIGVDLETITPRSTLSTHAHEEEILYVLRGRGFVRSPAGDIPLVPGSVAYTGPQVPHSVHNTDDDNLQYLVWEYRP